MDLSKIAKNNLWYLVGLITSDGCLSPDGRHVDITSKDYSFLSRIKDIMPIKNRVTAKYSSIKKKSYHIQISNKLFYKFLLSIGLKPNKSLTLGAVNIPLKYFTDFLRGIIDGDGNIRTWIHPGNKNEQWCLRIYSGSIIFIKWIKGIIEKTINVKGKIYFDDTNSKHGCYILKYGKMASIIILNLCYYKDSLCMMRKQELAYRCINSPIGWTRSKTIISNAGVLELVDS